MDFELRAAKEKWEREQRQNKALAKARLERERKAKEEAASRQVAIEASQSARRQEEVAAAVAVQLREEEDMWLGDGVLYDQVLQAMSIPGGGDKIRLPASVFATLSAQNALDKGPMLFQVSAASQSELKNTGYLSSVDMNGAGTVGPKSTHSGVLEFTSHEGFVELPPHVWKNAGLSEVSPPTARVRYVRLPKGTYAKLQTEGLDFADVSNHKAVLETKLRQHATLSVGDLLTVQHGGMNYDLQVLELKPSSSVSVLETDLEIDVVVANSDAQVGTSSQSRLVPLGLGKKERGLVTEGNYSYFKFSINSEISKGVAAGVLDILIYLEVEGNSDADIYVGSHPLLFPTQLHHEWSSHAHGNKLIRMSADKPVGPGMYSIGVYGFQGVTKFQISVEISQTASKQPAGYRVGNIVTDGDAVSQESLGQCENCKQRVPIKTIFLHEAYCRRHNSLCHHSGCGIVLRQEEIENHNHCVKCGQVFRKEELEKHMKVFHEPLNCSCGSVLEMKEMVHHKATVCPHRMITCRFCGDSVQAGVDAENLRDHLWGLTQHESSCGSRTAPCEICGRVIMLKESDLHVAASHSSKTASQVADPFQASTYNQTPSGRQGSLAERVSATSVECPICGKQFAGADATWQVSQHVEVQHVTQFETTEMDKDYRPETPVAVASPTPAIPRRRLAVSCPICGMAVHSERDLSSHMDMVH